jgi:hypothetical protein
MSEVPEGGTTTDNPGLLPVPHRCLQTSEKVKITILIMKYISEVKERITNDAIWG